MCLQCSAKARVVVKDIIPGYTLMRATKGCEKIVGAPAWPKGWYGLVQCNDPDFIWEGKPIADPTEGLTGDQINALPEAPFSRFHYLCEAIEKQFVTDPMTGYQFVQACKKAGYKPKRDGLNVVMWFVGYAGKKLKEKK